jgi:hypothetical protein
MPWVAAPTERELLSLEAALEDRTHNMSLPMATDSGELLPHWQSTWLPLLRASNGGSLAFDAATGSLLLVDFWDADFATIAASDLPTAVTLWSGLVEAGHFAWNGAGWTYEYLDLPLAARTSNLL